MPEVEPLRFPSREGRQHQQDQGDLQAVCPSRRRSCALVNTPSPCVNKSIFHIQELQRKVELWCQQPCKNLPYLTQGKKRFGRTMRFQSSDSDAESIISTELYIEGIGISLRGRGPWSPLRKETTDVLVEVAYLMERLESDRRDAEENLQQEKRRRKALEHRVDGISTWKLREHSAAVQKEHEACIRDIAELKWHLQHRKEKVHQLQENLVHMEAHNKGLHEDISFVKKHKPLVREKLELQGDILERMTSAQNEAENAHATTKSNLQALQEELQKIEAEASKERSFSNYDLKGIKDQLANRLEEIKQLKVHWEIQSVRLKEARLLVDLKEKRCAALLQRVPEMEEVESSANERVLELKIEAEEEVSKIEKLREQLAKLQDDIQQTKVNGDAEVSRLEELLLSKREDLTAFNEENEKCQRDVEDAKRKISESEKAVRQMRKDQKRMLQRLGENDQQRAGAKLEVTQVDAQHAATKARLEEQGRLTFMEEQEARKATESLKIQLMDKMKALALLESHCALMTEELQREESESELANQKLRKEYEEASSATRELETEVEGLRKLYDDKAQKINVLKEELKEMQGKHQERSANLEGEKNLKIDQLNAIKESHAATIKRCDYALSRTSELTNMSREYRDMSQKMAKEAETIADVIEGLQSAFDPVEFKHHSAVHLTNILQSDVDNCARRTQHCESVHTAHFATRQKKMEDTKEDLRTALKENNRLAKEYGDLQSTLLETKREAVRAMDKRNRAQDSFHFYTQLSLLQKRMHDAMAKHFKQRSLYSQAELDHCQALSRETIQRVNPVQVGLSEATRRISAFRRSSTDGSAANAAAAAAENRHAGAVGSRRSDAPA